MAEIKILYTIASKPGIQRDGTLLDQDFFSDGQWVRFQRGRPKKMGGMQRIASGLSGPISNILVWSRNNVNTILCFSKYGIEQISADSNIAGVAMINRTPSGWGGGDIVWSTTAQYDDHYDSSGTVIIAHAANSLKNIEDLTASKPYLGLTSNSDRFIQISDAPAVSGGVVSIAPYTVVYGSDGFVAWSDANLPQTWYTSGGNYGDSGADRVTGGKIVKGLPLRSGSGPAGLLWSLDSVLRMDYVGGGVIFKFTHLSTQSSILSQNGVIEYDGAYFWMGVDRFLVCDGSQVRELPNQMNINWVFDNLNFKQRQKVWVTKIPRYGEIWWHFPFGESEECTHAVIYNVREQTWYDTRSRRSAGFHSQIIHYPVMSSSERQHRHIKIALDYGTEASETLRIGDTVHGSTSQATAIVVRVITSDTTVAPFVTWYELELAAGSPPFSINETVTSSPSNYTKTVYDIRDCYSIYAHEKGNDLVEGDKVSAIESYFVTADFGLPTGGSQPNQIQGANRWTRLVRVEPDFIQNGEMHMTVFGREFANSPDTISAPYTFTSDTKKIDTREQAREIRLKFESNTVGGNYEMGRVILHLEPGDVRS